MFVPKAFHRTHSIYSDAGIVDSWFGVIQWHAARINDVYCFIVNHHHYRLEQLGVFFFSWRYNPHRGALASSLTRFLDHTQRRATFGRTPLNEWSVRRRGLYLTTHNTHNRQISMPRVGFEPTISAGERPKTYALDRAATGTGNRST